MNSIHDHNVYKYAVLCRESKIILHSEYDQNGIIELRLIEFFGVVGHDFKHALEGNILFGIEEQKNVSDFYRHYSIDLIKYSKFGLHLDTKSENSFVTDMKKRELKAFEISSSYGMSGWVISVGCKVSANSKK